MKQCKKKIEARGPHVLGSRYQPCLAQLYDMKMEMRQGRVPTSLLLPPHVRCEGRAMYLYTMHKSLALSALKSLSR